MATDIREVLGKYVPAAVLDQAVEEVRDSDISPEWWRQQAAELGGAAKERDELKKRLDSIESAPKRKEALKRVGVDYDAVPRYGQKALDSLPADKLDDLEFVANFVKEEGFEAQIEPEQQTGESTGAEQVTDFLTSQEGTPVRTTQQAKDAEFHAELDAAPDKAAATEVLRKYGRLAETQ